MKKRILSIVLCLVMLLGILPAAPASAAISAPSGYNNGNGCVMAYKYNSANSTFDLKGYHEGAWRSTTYQDNGYYTYIKTSSGTAQVVPKNDGYSTHYGLMVSIDFAFLNEGKTMQIRYTVKNTNSSAVSFSLGSSADVKIGSDDSAIITPFDNGSGFKMVSKNSSDADAQFNFFGMGYAGVSSVSDFWYGTYGTWNNAKGTVTFFGKALRQTTTSDSAAAWHWANKTVAAGESMSFAVLIGIGGAGSENAATGSAIDSPTGTVSLNLSSIATNMRVVVDGVTLTEGTHYTVSGKSTFWPEISFKQAAGLSNKSDIKIYVTMQGESSEKQVNVVNNIPPAAPNSANTTGKVVNVYCGENSSHSNMGFGFIDAAVYSTGSVSANSSGQWTCSVTFNTADLVERYNEENATLYGDSYPEHELASGGASRITLSFVWDTSAKAWRVSSVGNVNVVCKSAVITYTDGVAGQTLFADQVYTVYQGQATPAFAGTPSRAGYTFAGWSPNPSAIVSGNASYAATWTANRYTVTLDANGGSVNPGSLDVTFDEAVGTLPTPVRDGYTFTGWVDKNGNAVTAATVYTVAGNSTYTASWSANDYVVILDPNGGSVNPGSLDVTFDEAVGTLPTPVRDGYTFTGWVDENGNAVTAATVYTVAGSSTYTASWSANDYVVTLDANGGSVNPGSLDVTFDAALGTLPTPVRSGYTFTGWVDENGNAVTAATVYTVAGSSTYTATWSANDYVVILDANGGSVNPDSLDVTFDEAVGTLPTPVRDGYTFTGWVDERGNAVTAETVYTVAGNSTYTATWVANDYVVILDPNGGSVNPGSLDVTFDEAVGTLPTPVRTGYTFTGWVDERGNAVTAETVYTVVGDSTYTATWQANCYTVVFDANEGEGSMEDMPRIYDDAAALPECGFERYGYTFGGWNTAFDGSGDAYMPGDVVNLCTEEGDCITLYAQWNIIIYTVSFDSAGGSYVESQYIPHGSCVVYEAPTREGFAFDGWYLDGQLYDFETPVIGDFCLTAKWNQVLHVIPEDGQQPNPDNPGTPGGSGLPFVDVRPSDWFYGDIARVYYAGIMNGTSDTTFEPYTSLSRAMMATILYRLSGESYTGPNSAFEDVEDEQWYTEAIAWAAANGIVKGYDAQRFGPMDTVTREQAYAMLYRYANYKDMDVSAGDDVDLSLYADADDISAYAVPAVKWALGEGLVAGTEDGKLAPRSAMSRVLTAVAVSRLMG